MTGASIFGTAGQFLFKAGSAKPELSVTTFLMSPLIIGGVDGVHLDADQHHTMGRAVAKKVASLLESA